MRRGRRSQRAFGDVAAVGEMQHCLAREWVRCPLRILALFQKNRFADDAISDVIRFFLQTVAI